MATVDQRVVQMKFDNANFAQKAQATVDTLDKLKQASKFDDASQGFAKLNKAANNVNMSNLEDGVTRVHASFSAMQVAGMTAVSNLTTAAMGAGKKILSTIVNNGKQRALNIEQAKFQIEGLGMDYEKLSKDIDYAVQDTAYGYDEAAKAASQLGSSGVKAGTQMKTGLRAISGLASMTGSSYTDIANIFTTVAGNGRLMGEQLLQISSRGVNAAAAITKYLNNHKKLRSQLIQDGKQSNIKKRFEGISDSAKVTEEDVRNMASAGVISFQTFASAMDDAFGEHAKDANKTFEGSLANMKAALSRIGADYWDPLLVTGRDFFNFMRRLFDMVHTATKPLAANFGELLKPVSKFLTTADEAMGHFNKGGKELKMIDPKTLEQLKLFQKMLNNIGQAAHSVFQNVFTVVSALGKAFNQVFGFTSTFKKDNVFLNLSEQLKNFTSGLKMSDTTAKNLKDTFAGVFAIFDIIGRALSTVLQVIFPAADGVGSLGGAFLAVTGSIGRFLVRLDKAIQQSKVCQTVFEALGKVGEFIGKIFKTFGNSLRDAFSNVGVQADNVKQKFKPLEAIGQAVAAVFKMIAQAAAGIGGHIGKVFENMANAMTKMGKAGNLEEVYKLLSAGLLTGILHGVDQIFAKFKLFIDYGGRVGQLLASLKSVLIAYQRELNSRALFNIAKGLGLMAVSLLLLSSIDPKHMAVGLAGLAGLMLIITPAMEKMMKMGSAAKNPMQMMTKIFAPSQIKRIAEGILIMSIAMKIVSTMDWEGVAKGLVAMWGLTEIMSLFMDKMGMFDKGFIFTATSLVILGAALAIFAADLKKLGDMSDDELTKGLLGMIGVLGALAGFMKILQTGIFKKNIGLGQAAAIISIAASLTAITQVVGALGNMDTKSLIKGLAGVGALLTELGIFMKALQTGIFKSNMGPIAAAGIYVLAEALTVVGDVIVQLGDLNEDQLANGLIGVAGALGAIAVAVKMIPKTALLQAAAIYVVAQAMDALCTAVQSFANFNEDQMTNMLLGFGLSLGILAVGLKAMNGTLVGSAALLVASVAMMALAAALSVFANFDIKAMAMSLGMMAATLGILGAAGYLLGPAAPGLLFFAIAIQVLGGALTLFGKGLFITSKAMIAFGAGVTSTLGGVVVVAESIATAIPIIFAGLAQGVIEFVKGIGDGAEEIAKSFTKIVSAVIDSLSTLLPKIGAFGANMIMALLVGIRNNIGQITTVAAQIIVQFVNALAAQLPIIVNAAMNFIIAFVNALANAIRIYTPQLIAAMKNLGSAMIEAFLTAIQEMVKDIPGIGGKLNTALELAKTKVRETLAPDAMKDIGKKGMDGTAKGIESSGKNVEKAAGNVSKKGAKAAGKNAKEYGRSGKKSGSSYTDALDLYQSLAGGKGKGISDAALKGLGDKSGQFQKNADKSGSAYEASLGKHAGKAGQKGKDIGDKSKTGLEQSNASSSFKTTGDNCGSGFVSSLGNWISRAFSKGFSLGSSAVTGAKKGSDSHSPSKAMIKVGNYMGQGLIIGMQDYYGAVTRSGQKLGRSPVAAMSNAIGMVTDLFSADMSLSPTITPVVDLSDVSAGVSQMHRMFSGPQSLGITADSMNARIQNGFEVEGMIKDLKDSLDKAAAIRTNNNTFNISGVGEDPQVFAERLSNNIALRLRSI